MSPSEQHLALCEWMGWKRLFVAEGECLSQYGPPALTLDWLRECMLNLKEKSQQDSFCLHLAKVTHSCVTNDYRTMNVIAWKFATASAEQICEALCRTLWPEKFTE